MCGYFVLVIVNEWCAICLYDDSLEGQLRRTKFRAATTT